MGSFTLDSSAPSLENCRRVSPVHLRPTGSVLQRECKVPAWDN